MSERKIIVCPGHFYIQSLRGKRLEWVPDYQVEGRKRGAFLFMENVSERLRKGSPAPWMYEDLLQGELYRQHPPVRKVSVRKDNPEKEKSKIGRPKKDNPFKGFNPFAK